jgi:ATP-dependent 26S proteasome regulatory subunit
LRELRSAAFFLNFSDALRAAAAPAQHERVGGNRGVSCARARLCVHFREMEAKVRNLRMDLREKNKEYDKTEDDLKALQSVGQIIGELLRQLDDERYIVKASSGPRYVVGCRNKVFPPEMAHGLSSLRRCPRRPDHPCAWSHLVQVSRADLKPGTRVTLDMTTLTIMRILPREVDPLVYHMAAEDPGKVNLDESAPHFLCSGRASPVLALSWENTPSLLPLSSVTLACGTIKSARL